MAAWKEAFQRILDNVDFTQDIRDAEIGRLDQLITKYPEAVELRIRKADWIRLGTEDSVYSLEDARDSLLEAIEIDPDHPEALAELGWYEFVIEDSAETAIVWFKHSMDSGLTESNVAGCVQALTELGRLAEARETFDRLLSFRTDLMRTTQAELEMAETEARVFGAIASVAGTPAGEYGVDLFISHHIEEIESSYWQRHLGTSHPTREQVLKLLVFVEDPDPDQMTFDVTLPDGVTDYVLALRFTDQGEIEEITMES